MKINGREVVGRQVAFDGCHKIYVIEDDKDLHKATELEYEIYDVDKIQDIYNQSCPLRFISNWKLDKCYVKQFDEIVEFEY